MKEVIDALAIKSDDLHINESAKSFQVLTVSWGNREGRSLLK